MAKKGLNMEKVVEIRSEVEEVMENTPTIVTEMAEHVGASLEDIDALREMCVEEFEKELELLQEREENRMKELKNKVDNGIKYAIISGKGVESDAKFVSGKARGADSLGERYARENNYKIAEFPAKWNEFGKRAGYIRNEEMAKYADACVCFWDYQSKGTKHMINLAKAYSLKLRVVKY